MLPVVPLAILLDAALGDPPRLWSPIGHPVTWFGAVIAKLDRTLNNGRFRRVKGVAAILLAVVLFSGPAAALEWLPFPVGQLIEIVAAATLIAHRSLHEHVAAVADAASLEAGRRAVAMIVGRDTAALDEAGISGAALESLGESLSDGVVAPVFWLAVLGLPGIVAYKVVNTADSMVGHRTERHAAFGWAAARLDDAMNIVPARLTAILICFAVPRRHVGLGAVAADARRHLSPNAGWPEAALAQVLGVALGGPRSYDGEPVEGVRLNASGRAPDLADIRRGLAISTRVGVMQFALYCVLAAAVAG